MEVSTAKCPSFSCQIRVTNTEWIRKLCWCCEIFFWNVATSDLWRNLEQVSFRDTSPLLSPPESPFGWCACKHNHFYFNNFAGHIYKKYEARSEMKVCFQDLVWSPSLAHLDLKLAASRTFDTHSPQHTVLIKFRLASFFEDKKSSQNIEKVLEKKNTHNCAAVPFSKVYILHGKSGQETDNWEPHDLATTKLGSNRTGVPNSILIS